MGVENPSLTDAQIGAIARRIRRPIVLVGLMGTGKSTVGRKLAEITDVNFCDTDDEIELAAQLSVAEIFDQFGEQYFRDGERRVIARLLQDRSGVIATGGGAFIDEETRKLLLEQAITVWIDCSLETLVARTSRKNTRPLLQTGKPEEILAELMAERRPFYQQAHIHVSGTDGPHIITACHILEAIEKWL